MKILHVIQTMSTRYGGPVSFLRALSHSQARAGHTVTICTTNTDYPKGILPVQTDKPVYDYCVNILFHPVQFQPLLFSLQLMNWIGASITKFDIVHIHGLYRFPVSYAAWSARKFGLPYIIRPHGSLDPYLYRQSRYSVLLKRLYERVIDFPNINGASAIHYTTQEELEGAKYLNFKAKPVVVPNGIDWIEFSKLPCRGDFRSRIGIDKDTPVVLFLGRLNFKKGLDLLISAFSKVVKVLPKTQLALVGPDNEGYRKNIHRWCKEFGIEKSVFTIDHLTAKQVRQAYVDADLFVLPSYTENFGMTVVEAMACKCPVVLSDRVNLSRVVQHAKAGLVVKLKTEELARAVIDILENKTLSKSMGEAGRVLVKSQFSCDRIVELVTPMYKSAIKEKLSAK
jgi:glycosyltransferase involved in cell wall biosynthesis